MKPFNFYRWILTLIAIFQINSFIQATVYYVAPTGGSDSNSGTDTTQAWATWQKAFDEAKAGDTVYFRGGIWYPESSILYSPDHGRGNNGTYGNLIVYMNYPGEKPIRDCINYPESTTSRAGMTIDGITYVKFKGLTIRNVRQTTDQQWVTGMGFSNCKVFYLDNIVTTGHGGSGMRISEWDTLYMTNCDSYNNIDSTSVGIIGGRSDGYTISSGGEAKDIHKIAYISGCRAWYNSDDGFDISSTKQLIVHDCWSWANGRLYGDASGFKWLYSSIRNPSKRKVYNTITAYNYNNSEAGSLIGGGHVFVNLYDAEYGIYQVMYNNSSYKDTKGHSSALGEFDCETEASAIYRNNLVYDPISTVSYDRFASFKACDYGYPTYVTQDHNSWVPTGSNYHTEPNDTFDITDADFISLDTAQLRWPRKPGGSLPDINFLKLVPGSDLIDGGTYVGVKYSDNAPDIGAFESGSNYLDNYSPYIVDISNQTIAEGGTFSTIDLNSYVVDPDHTDDQITWTFSGNSQLTVSINQTAKVATFTSTNAEWNGSEAIIFTATDPGGLYDTDQATFTVTYVNDAPVVSNIPNQTIVEGETFATIDLNSYVVDPDHTNDQITWTFSGNNQLTVTINQTTKVATITSMNAEWNGSEAITFTATDPGGIYGTDQATFTVSGVNDVPVVSDIPNQIIAEGEAFADIDLNNYVNDPDNTDDEISWICTGYNKLIVIINPVTKTVNATPKDPEWNGSETITFRAADPGGLYDTDQITFVVTPVNDAPVVDDIPNQAVPIGDPFISVNLNNYVNDPDNTNDQITWTCEGNSQLTVTINQTTKVAAIEPINSEWTGSETITFTATDDGGLYNSDQVLLTVSAFSDPPVIDNIPDQTISEGSTFSSINLNNYVSDPNFTNDQITWTNSGNIQLAVDINTDTKVAAVIAPGIDWTGTETITFTATNPGGLFSDVQVTFTVIIVNNPPEIENQDFIISLREFDDDYIGRVHAYDPDAGQKIYYTIITGNESGFFDLNPENGDLKTTVEFDLNQASSEYNLLVSIEDDGDLVKSDTATIKVIFLKRQITFYIDPTNHNDPLSDGTFEHPFGSWNSITWEDSCTYLQRRGTISYESKINIRASNVSLGSYGEGEPPVIQSTANDFAMRAFQEDNLNIKDLHIIAPDGISCIYLLGSANENKIDNCILEDTENGVRIIDSKSVTICYSTFINCSSAIYSFAESNRIYYNIFRNNQVAINITNYPASTEIYNSVFYGNSTGVSVSYSDLIQYNNIFYLENAGDIAVDVNMDKLVSDNNIFYPDHNGFISVSDRKYSTLTEFQQNLGLDLRSFNADPQFRDVYNNDFAVSVYSPAIDAGRTVGLQMDFYGTMVPYGKSTDIGLAEAVTGLFTPVPSIKLSDAEDNQHSLTVFPNPSDGKFNINLEKINRNFTKASIIDIAGRIVYEKYYYPYDSELFLYVNVSHIPKGIYMVVLHDGDRNYFQRIIIN